MEKFPLNKDQQLAFDAIEATSSNYFITGKPGVGKSVLINALVEDGRKTYTLAAPTGLAALNIDGRTLHSLFRLPMFNSVIETDYNVFPSDDRVINNIRYNIKHLIIDEISMVRADMLDYIDRLMRYAKNKPDEPFGGTQLILVGDYFQLPPVATGIDLKVLRELDYNSAFAFDSKVYKEGNFKTLQLNQVMRQKGDDKFIKILHSARSGSVTIPQISVLNKNVGRVDDLRPTLCGTNQQAEQINQGQLNKLEGEVHSYTCAEFGQWPAYPADKDLRLKVGAQIMVKKNGADRRMGDRNPDFFMSRVVNGTIGIVIAIDKDHVLIQKEDGEEVKIYRQRWERKIKQKDVDGDWEEQVVASFEQMPLSLAWAISIHKSQGQSFDKILVDPSRIFAPGQLYVALSRGRTLEGIRFTSMLKTSKFFANASVKQFYKSIGVQ